jgi:hypothetical protein
MTSRYPKIASLVALAAALSIDPVCASQSQVARESNSGSEKQSVCTWITQTKARCVDPSFADEITWVRSTSLLRLVPAPKPPAPLDAYGTPPYEVLILGTQNLSSNNGYLESGFTGRLSSGQDVMVVPLTGGGATGGSNVYALVFTRVNGSVRYAGYLQSPTGHLEISLAHGQLLVSYPIFGPQGDNCCPPKTHYATYMLHGTHLQRNNAWIKENVYPHQ